MDPLSLLFVVVFWEGVTIFRYKIGRKIENVKILGS